MEDVPVPFKAFWVLLMRLAETDMRVKQVEQLNALSEEALATRGMTRDDIVHYVFRGCL